MPLTTPLPPYTETRTSILPRLIGLILALAIVGCQAPDSAPSQAESATFKTALKTRVHALEGLSRSRSDSALAAFVGEHLGDSLRRARDRDSLFTTLRTIGRVSARAGGVTVTPQGTGALLSLTGPASLDVRFSLENSEPHRIASLRIERAEGTQKADTAVSIAPITWSNLEERLAEEAAAGFAGTVLITRNGEIQHHRGYGFADRAADRPNTTETVYGIGSTPIDFTRAAILHLKDRGLLQLSDSISRFFSEVPRAKQSITIRHLLNGRSGLPNFHHDPDDDKNYDLSWIDREEAVDRILSADLLFRPGADEAHSHSAFTLLAAIVEQASGRSYRSYLEEAFFRPFRMTKTGFYGPSSGFTAEEMAVGYGPSRVGTPNIPLNWGKTSWLVMGSGGMVSNPHDMYRWVRGIRGANGLSEKSLQVYGTGHVLSGGSDRGFYVLYVDDPSSAVFLASNAHKRPGDRPAALARELARLVTREGRASGSS